MEKSDDPQSPETIQNPAEASWEQVDVLAVIDFPFQALFVN